MELRRFMLHFTWSPLSLLVLATLVFSDLLSGLEKTVEQSLDCTNDYSHFVFCEFEAQTCSQYRMNLTNLVGYWDRHCNVKLCESGRCCCSFDDDAMVLVPGESHRVIVSNESETVASKVFGVTDTMKPRVPTITSVKESNGNVAVTWKTNMNENLTANLTYGKKGDTEKITKHVNPTKSKNELDYYELLGRDLEPSTVYVISVRTHFNLNGRFSDSSAEVEFKTSMSPHILILAVIISLSIAAVLISGALYSCYVKLKTVWWDECPKPEPLNIDQYKQEVLKPLKPIMCSISVEPLVPDDKLWSKGSPRNSSSESPQQSSGISTGSSCFSYANTAPVDVKGCVEDAVARTLANLISPFTTTELAEPTKDGESPYNPPMAPTECHSSGSSNYDNKTYLFLSTAAPENAVEASEGQTQAAPAACASDLVITTYQQAPPCVFFAAPPDDLPVMAVDMPYQQCNVDSGTVLCAEDSGSTSVFSGSNTAMFCDPVYRCESSGEVDGGNSKLSVKTVENPSSGCVPAASHSFLPAVDDSQASQKLLMQPNISFPERRSVNEEDFTRITQNLHNPFVSGFTNNVKDGYAPFLSAIPADTSMMADGGYHCV